MTYFLKGLKAENNQDDDEDDDIDPDELLRKLFRDGNAADIVKGDKIRVVKGEL